jgi:hypothetical protein
MLASSLADSGVHGALMALDDTFDVPVLAHILQLPETDPAFHNLQNQFDRLVAEYRAVEKGGKIQKGRTKDAIGRKD